MKITESAEMYLETIHILPKKDAPIRSIDIARKMGFSNPSVSRAVSNLKNEGCILTDSNGYISLTDKGLAIAKKIYERHEILTDLLISLGIDPQTEEDDACRIEHVISDESFGMIKKHLKEKRLPDNTF